MLSFIGKGDRGEEMTFITENLAIGNVEDAKNSPPQINALLNVADDAEFSPKNQKYHRIPLRDGVPIPVEKMKEAIDWIKKNESNKIMVFCKYGAGRSASILIGYLCSIGFSYGEAVKFMRSKKSDIKPLPLLAKTIKMAFEK
jgi:protein-tyrosine phosphatase